MTARLCCLGWNCFKLLEVTEYLCRLNGPMSTYLAIFHQTNFLLFLQECRHVMFAVLSKLDCCQGRKSNCCWFCHCSLWNWLWSPCNMTETHEPGRKAESVATVLYLRSNCCVIYFPWGLAYKVFIVLVYLKLPFLVTRIVLVTNFYVHLFFSWMSLMTCKVSFET
jgi:hypothetical protein